MEISMETFDRICRACLSASSNMKSLFTKLEDNEQSLLDLFSLAANLSPRTVDGFPKQVCCECEVILYKAEEFRKMCLHSESVLKKVFESSTHGNFDAVPTESYSDVVKTDRILDKLCDFELQVADKTDLIDFTESFDPDDNHKHETSLQQPVKNEIYENNQDFENDFDSNEPLQMLPMEFKEEALTKSKLQKKSPKYEESMVFSCKDCKLNFEDLKTWQSHLETHTLNKVEETTFQCSLCFCRCKTKKTLSKHMKQHAQTYENNQDFENDFDNNEPLQMLPMEFKEEAKTLPNPHYKSINSQYKKLPRKTKLQKKNPKYEESIVFSCKDCKLNFEDLKTWQSHLESHSLNTVAETTLLQCSLCFRRCKTKKTLSKHMKLHAQTDNIKYSCDKCKREFKYKSFLENHVISVHMHDDFSCHLCTDKFKSKESLEAHIDTHKENKKHVCNICNKAFLMLCTLKDHLRKHTGEKPFLCCTCGKGFSQKTNLAQHTRRHLGVKPFKCDICFKSFVSKGELDAHNRKHSGAHPFVCDDCGNGFTTSSALVKHRRTHTGERPYACDLCPMRFAASGTLKNHRRTHTGERPFQCSLCEKAFVQRTDLVSHIRCHTGERPYICSQCGQAFRKAAALKTHLKMHGKELGIIGVNVVLNGISDGQLNS